MPVSFHLRGPEPLLRLSGYPGPRLQYSSGYRIPPASRDAWHRVPFRAGPVTPGQKNQPTEPRL